MPGTETAERGRRLLAQRIAEAPAAVARVPDQVELNWQVGEPLPRCLVTTGLGTSEAHARHLSEVAYRSFGLPARFVATGAVEQSALHESPQDWLIVFSQGLSANARYALQNVERWGRVLLISCVPKPGEPGFEDLDVEKREWIASLLARGVHLIDMGCGLEYGALIRVIGARAGYAVSWSLLRSLRAREMQSAAPLAIAAETLASAQTDADQNARVVFPGSDELVQFFARDRTLLLVASHGMLELASHLSLKIAEGLLRPAPQCVDILSFAHGPLQSIADRPASILYLADSIDSADSLKGDSNAADSEWGVSLRETLDSALHDLRILESDLAAPFSVIEFEAILDALILRTIEETGADLVDWPGRDREEALYSRAPLLATNTPPGGAPRATGTSRTLIAVPVRAAASLRSEMRRERRVSPSFEQAVWTEMDAALEAGRTTALIGLGSTEQHGPHLPLATDTWIADSLLSGLVARIEGAWALPAFAFGCASEHLAFAGTISLSPEALEATLGDCLDSLALHGFKRAFLFSAHGGNVDALDAMRGRLEARAQPMQLEIDTDLSAVSAMQASAVQSAGLAAAAAGPHAGEYETSFIAALYPEAVRSQDLVPGRIAAEDEAQSLFYPSLRDRAPQGVVGDPSAASADRGVAYRRAWVDLLEEAYYAAFSEFD